MKLIDALGREHRPVAPHSARIVSLVPSITELLCDLGLAPVLVGRTGFCVHPRSTLRAIPKVGGTKDVNLEKLRALAPTHLVVNIDENNKETVDAAARFVPNIVVTHPMAPGDCVDLYRLLGGLFGTERAAEALCTEFESEYAALRTLPPRAPQTMMYCIWKDPWMTVSADTYIARMMAEIGWRCWNAPDPAVRYPRFDWSQQVLDQIDGILLSSEPYRFTEAHADALRQQTAKPVRLVDGEMMSWYGSRAVAGLRYLRRLRTD
jgi:ABC-type Fe3+-hydroxamate transport system substrate-binding protein